MPSDVANAFRVSRIADGEPFAPRIGATMKAAATTMFFRPHAPYDIAAIMNRPAPWPPAGEES